MSCPVGNSRRHVLSCRGSNIFNSLSRWMQHSVPLLEASVTVEQIRWVFDSACKDQKAPKYRKATKIPESTYKYQKKMENQYLQHYVICGERYQRGSWHIYGQSSEWKKEEEVCVCVLSLTPLSTIFQSFRYNGVWMSLYWVFISNSNSIFLHIFRSSKGRTLQNSSWYSINEAYNCWIF